MLFMPSYGILQRLYKSGKNDDMHRYTLHPDDPDFVRAKINAQQISDVRSIFTNHMHLMILLNPLRLWSLLFFQSESLQGIWGAGEDGGL